MENRDRPPLLRRTDWDVHLHQHLTTPGGASALASITALPSQSKDHLYIKLMEVGQLWLYKVKGDFQQLGENERCMLQSFPRCNEPWDWDLEKTTETLYSQFAIRFTTSLLRSLDNKQSNTYTFPLTVDQKVICRSLGDALSGARESSMDDLLQHYQKLLFCTIMCPINFTAKFNLPMSCFLALHNLRDEGGFRQPKDTTSSFTHLKFIMRCIVLREACLSSSGVDFVRCLHNLCQENLNHDVPSPYSEAVLLQQFATSLALSTISSPATTCNDNFTEVQHKGVILELPKLRHGLQQILRLVWTAMLSFTDGIELKYNISDALGRARQPGDHSWLGTQRVLTIPPRHALCHYMEQLGMWEMSDSKKGWPSWNIPKCQKFLQLTAQVVTLFASLNYISPDVPQKGTSIFHDRIQDGNSKRNIYLENGQLLFIRRPSQQSIYSHEKSVILHVPKKLSQAIVYYLALVRPLEVVIAQVVYGVGSSQAELYKEFFYVQNGTLLDSNTFSKQIGGSTKQYFG
ncbi:hypothetical protein BDM02DRAFT_3194258, partial [Thelephora ganbajun]